MAVEQSILISTKKKLGLDKDYTDFDLDIIDFINGSFFRLNQLGLGPPEGFAIEDETETWDAFNTEGLNVTALNAIKTYVTYKVRLDFDPPGTPHHIQAMKDQIAELEYTLNTERDITKWMSPSSLPSLP